MKKFHLARHTRAKRKLDPGKTNTTLTFEVFSFSSCSVLMGVLVNKSDLPTFCFLLFFFVYGGGSVLMTPGL